MGFVPKDFYALEKAVLLIARELNIALWDHTKMPLAEINAYEGLGEKTHSQDLDKIVREIELGRRDRKTGELPDNRIAERLEAYKSAQRLLRGALNAGELHSFLQVEETGQRLQLVAEAWAQDNAMNWFDDGRIFVSTGSSARVPFGFYVPGAPDDVNFVDVPKGFWASILIDHDSFSDWYYSASGPMADVDAREKDRGGRPPEHNWDAVKAYALEMVRQHGFPGPGNKKFPTKNQLVEDILNKWASRGLTLASSSVRRYVNHWLKEL